MINLLCVIDRIYAYHIEIVIIPSRCFLYSYVKLWMVYGRMDGSLVARHQGINIRIGKSWQTTGEMQDLVSRNFKHWTFSHQPPISHHKEPFSCTYAVLFYDHYNSAY